MRDSRPNVVFVVWDACRVDYAREHAPTLSSLAEDNLTFDRAVTPGCTSLPSHVSMVTGAYPHEHGIVSQRHEVTDQPVLAALADCGYASYGVSANGFASPMYRFDAGFDAFYNTQAQMVSTRGLDVHAFGRRLDDGASGASRDDLLALARAVATHDYPLASLANVASAGLTELVGSVVPLQRVPHRRFSPYSEFYYDPADNTRTLERLFEREADRERPFFAFVNYMDTHHPYTPPERFQRETYGRTVGYRELGDLADRTHPLRYLAARERGEEPLSGRRDLLDAMYAGEVRTADHHLRRLLDALERHGLRDDTLVVVTADHGENLGERDPLGGRRVGHVASASDQLARVPLVVAHPDVDPGRIEEPVSLTALADLFTDPWTRLAVGTTPPLVTDDPVLAEQPNGLTPALRDRHPEIADVLDRDVVAGYAGDWRLVADSMGARAAVADGAERDPDAAPGALVERVEEALAGLAGADAGERDLSASEQAHLEALGYL